MLLSLLLYFYILFFVRFFFFIFITHKKHRKYINQLIHNLYIFIVAAGSVIGIIVAYHSWTQFLPTLFLSLYVHLIAYITFQTHNSHNNNEEVSTAVVIKMHNNWLTNQTYCFCHILIFSFMVYYRSSLHNLQCSFQSFAYLCHFAKSAKLESLVFKKGESFIFISHFYCLLFPSKQQCLMAQ